eukprot:11995036-Alexandrium_andersonii.AAC.1
MFCPEPSLEGRSLSSPNGPNGPLRGSESASVGAPLFRGGRPRRRASRRASGTGICTRGAP